MALIFRKHWVPLMMVVVGAGLFAAVGADVVAHGRLAEADPKIAKYVHGRIAPWGVWVAAAFSGLGEARFLVPGAVVVGGVLWRWRRWRELGMWAVGLLGSVVICAVLKGIFAVPRPARFTLYAFKEGSGFSFPSGHTMGATIAAGLVVILWMRMRKRGVGARWAAGGMVAAVGMLVAGSLVYVGVHYVTDVLGGLGVSLAWLGVMRWVLPAAE